MPVPGHIVDLGEQGSMAPQRRLTAEERENIVTLYEERTPVDKIVDRVGVSKQTVYDVLNAAGVERRNTSRASRPSWQEQLETAQARIEQLHRELADAEHTKRSLENERERAERRIDELLKLLAESKSP